jgi:imidazoleglycerol phosphate synthase glutamine amidotransferase subunit HisH
VIPENKDIVNSTSEYCGIEYCAGINSRNIYGFQFHPEKSGITGLKIYRNFAEIVKNNIKK